MLFFLPGGVKVFAARFVFADPSTGKFAILDLFQHPAHDVASLAGYDLRPARVIAVLGRVAYRIAHVVEASAIHQINDQLQFVKAFEVRDLRLIAGLYQRLESGFHQRAYSAAKRIPLTEPLSLSLFS